MSAHKVGVFGGSFDPIHVGHLYIANAIATQRQLDRVLFLPVGSPAHRSTHAPATDRSAMVQLAIAGNDRFALDDTALRQEGPVYTADTLPLLRARYAAQRLSFIAGSDSLVNSPWRRFEEVLEALDRFYVVVRAQAPADAIAALVDAQPPHLAARIEIVQLPLVHISASTIRADIAAARSVRYLVPDPVIAYIAEHKLYSD
ncbi:MAG: nicotinate-nucleotide adenylyltransferase [Candidatus Eremiobacteraeota bacterium]|nr:nicotinate-nucleotide adenylyltransferase [Candidatus Eremiobacteraeota bacterium]